MGATEVKQWEYEYRTQSVTRGMRRIQRNLVFFRRDKKLKKTMKMIYFTAWFVATGWERQMKRGGVGE